MIPGIDPTIATIIAVVSAMTAFISIILTFRSANRKTDSEFKTAMDARIDERVKEQLTEAWKEIDGLKEKVNKLEQGEIETRSIVRTFFQRLLNWDRRGRQGRMPMPTHAEMKRLGVEDLSITDTDTTQTAPAVDLD